MTEQSAKQRPFHESIVDAINRASYGDMRCLGMLISETKIPKGHDEILAAWNFRQKELNVFVPIEGVEAGLLEQKQEAEKKEKEKKTKEQMEPSAF